MVISFLKASGSMKKPWKRKLIQDGVCCNTNRGMRVAGRMAEDNVYMKECNVGPSSVYKAHLELQTGKPIKWMYFCEDYKNHSIECV